MITLLWTWIWKIFSTNETSCVGSWESTLNEKAILTINDFTNFCVEVGAGKFEAYIGKTVLRKGFLAQRQMNSPSDGAEAPLSRQETVKILAEQLIRRLQPFVEASDPEISKSETEMMKEAEEMARMVCGTELLHLIGSVYKKKASPFVVPDHKPFSLDVAVEGLIFKLTMDLQDSVLKYIEILDEGETPEVQRAYLESAAVRMVQVNWSLIHIEVASLLRDVCDKVLENRDVSETVLRRRAQGLLRLANTFEGTARFQHFEPGTRGKKLQEAVAKAEASFNPVFAQVMGILSGLDTHLSFL